MQKKENTLATSFTSLLKRNTPSKSRSFIVVSEAPKIAGMILD